MDVKRVIFAALVLFPLLRISSVCQAVDTGDIDRVRTKEVLDPAVDFPIIDNFVAEGVRELVRTRDFTAVAKVRAVILSRRSSRKESARAQYAGQFFSSVHKRISEAFDEALSLSTQERQFIVTLNLLILVDNLESLQLADLAVKRLNDENKVIRYWAVHCVTNLGFVQRLNGEGAGNSGLAESIAERLAGLVGSSDPEILALIAGFAGEVNIPQGEDLLLQIADHRVKRYADWTVEYEILDGTILRLLFKKMSGAGLSRPAVARRFGQLYSYVIQRYVKGQDFLRNRQKRQLASVLADTEKSCIGNLLGTPQSTIRKAVGQGDYEALLSEHDRLLGGGTGTGELPGKLNFDYGKMSNGARRTAPLALPEPPRRRASIIAS